MDLHFIVSFKLFNHHRCIIASEKRYDLLRAPTVVVVQIIQGTLYDILKTSGHFSAHRPPQKLCGWAKN